MHKGMKVAEMKPFKLASREFHKGDSAVYVGKVKIGQGSLAMIAGPCAIESEDQLMAAAVGVPAVQEDWNGVLQAGGSIGVAGLTATGLKEAFPEWRPDRSDRKSFPSGHTSMAFASAATLNNHRCQLKRSLPGMRGILT